ncbi:hypothetical protein TSAR_012645 [Trichomalopsis sarcophagae]|uniref:Uncharacterized protein n=1 Tax=Trichomalopsis sarcophagae TaxID=543379 RepID=A0A232FJD0_9HYME|nr:hypothetical protein TSAR_012645 [Trichomalopsis sarcophagae]
MLRLCWVVVFSCLICGLTVSAVETKPKEKQTVSTAAVEADGPLANDRVNVAMEGQPLAMESVTSNTAKINSIKTIVKKESKTVPRKGVVLDKDKSTEKTDQNDAVNLNITSEKPIVEKVNASYIIPEPKKEIVANTSTTLSTTEKSTTELHVAPVREAFEEKANNTISTTRKPKPKPERTIGGNEADEPIPAYPTNKSPLGMPSKIDYIVPVVITITALPLLGVAFYVLYKRGRDYWDKRHYRRMDFLIDGMYNE